MLIKPRDYNSNLSKEVEVVLRSSGLSPIKEVIKGKSGVFHVFDAAATDGDGTLVAVDIAHSDKLVDEVPLLRFYVKCLDTNSEKRILLCIPGATEKTKKLAPIFSVIIVECKDLWEVSEGLRSALMSYRK
jgi:hypothetical protein